MMHSIKKRYSQAFLWLPIIIFFGVSCVYYNTFYNAETAFKKANQIIEESPLLEKGDIPPQAKKLLGEAIDNGRIVLEKYADSKYVDDAYFLISKSSFLRGEVANAEKYIKLLLREYPNSRFVSEAEVWMAYTQFRMGLSDSAAVLIANILINRNPEKYERYLIHNIKAEMAMDQNEIDLALDEYELAAELAASNSMKTAMYSKLVNIAETHQKIERVVEYLDQLAVYAPEQIRRNAKMDWIKYNRQLGNYEETITEIESLLGQTDYLSIYIRLELEQAKIYLDQRDFKTAKLLFSQLTENYERKNESAEALYMLGYIALMEDFDLVLAEEYFENSKKDKSSSEYGKKAKEMKKVIADFNLLIDEYDYLISNPEKEDAESDSLNIDIIEDVIEIDDEVKKRIEIEEEGSVKGHKDEELIGMKNRTSRHSPMPQVTKKANPDSLLFTIAEKLLYDFQREDVALERFKELVADFPDSKFRSQAIFVLSHFDADSMWNGILETEYPESKFQVETGESIKATEEELARDKAWNLAEISYTATAEEFMRLYEEGDTLALYLYAFVQDQYLNDLSKAVDAFQIYTDLIPDDEHSKFASQRLSDIQDGLDTEVGLTLQKKNYSIALSALNSGEDLDSVIMKMDMVMKGDFSEYRSSAQQLTSRLNALKLYRDALVPDTSGTLSLKDSLNQLYRDSLYFNLGEIYHFDLNLNDSAEVYYKKVINDFDSTHFRYPSLVAMLEIDPKGVWNAILIEEFPDSIVAPDSVREGIHIINDINSPEFIEEQVTLLTSLEDLKLMFSVDDTIEADTTQDVNVVEIMEFKPEMELNLPGIIDADSIKSNLSEPKIENKKSQQEADFIFEFIDTSITQPVNTENESTVTLLAAEQILPDHPNIDTVTTAPNTSLPIELLAEFTNSIPGNTDTTVVVVTESTPIIVEEILPDSVWSEYIIGYGDDLQKIALNQLGSAQYWSIIYEWNKEEIGEDPGMIYPYQVISIYDQVDTQVKVKENAIYQINKGESLWDIATKIYQDPYAWMLLYQDNQHLIINPDEISPGNELVIRTYLTIDEED